jgi:hypothetical protein
LGHFTKNFLPKKLSISSQKYRFGIRDQGSEICNTGGKYQFGRISLLPAESVVMKGLYTKTGDFNRY